MSNLLEARIISVTNEEVSRIIGKTSNGSILNATFNWDKIGGLLDFTLVLRRDAPIPLFPGARIDFYFRDETFLLLKKLYSGYVEKLPNSENDETTIEIVGKGFSKKLETKILTQTFNSQSIENIITSLDYSGLDLSPVFDVDAPYIIVGSTVFEKKTYKQVFDRLLQIANTAYQSEQFIWGINEERQIYFKPLPSTGSDVKLKLFEGYQFYSPDVEEDDKVINKIDFYRATLADSKETEFQGTYENVSSQDKYGVKEVKIVSDDHIPDATAPRIANSILEEFEAPKKRISIKNYRSLNANVSVDNAIFNEAGGPNNAIFEETQTNNWVWRNSLFAITEFDRVLEPDYYGLSTKPQIKETILSEFDDLSLWTVNTPTSTIVEDTTTVLSGRRCFKWSRASGQPTGDYIEYTLPTIIDGIISVTFFIKFTAQVPNLTLQLFDRKNNSVSKTFTSGQYSGSELQNTWLETTFILDGTSMDSYLLVKKPAQLPTQLFVTDNTVDKRLLVFSANPFLANINKIRLELGVGTAETNEFFIDRLSARHRSWTYSRLALEKATYRIDRDQILGDFEFGDRKDTLAKEVLKKVVKGDISFDLYARG